MRLIITILLSATIFIANAQRPQADVEKVKGRNLTIQPITHATLILSYNKKNIYIDPTGGAAAFTGLAAPDMIIITDIHGDHFDLKTIEAINTNNAWLVVPQAVADKIPASLSRMVIVLNNGNKKIGRAHV